MLPVTDLVVLVVYIVVIVGLGCWFARRSGDSQSFMIAGGRIPGWAVGLSIFGTFLSSNTFLGVPGKAFSSNWNSFVFSLTLPFAGWIATRWFVPFYRNVGSVSAYEHLEQRFGLWARVYAVICYLLTQIGRMGAIMFGVALGLRGLTGWPIEWIIIVSGLLVTLYTLIGGIEAVIWTDVIQSIVLSVGAVIVLALLWSETPGGMSGSFDVANQYNKLSLGSWSASLTESTVWVVFFFGLFINLGNFGVDQSYVQRYQTAKTEREAKRAVWLGALLYVPVSLLFFVIGSALFSYYDANPKMLAEVRQLVSDEVAMEPGPEREKVIEKQVGDRVLPHFISNKLPYGLAGLLVAAIAAAAMSSIDTSLNSSATVFLKDLHPLIAKSPPSETRSLMVLRAATVVMGVIGTSAALGLIGVGSILDAWWMLQGVFAGGVLGLFLLGQISRLPNSYDAAIAVTIGVVAIAWLTLSPKLEFLDNAYKNPLHSLLTIVVGTTLIVVAGALMGVVRRAGRDAQTESENH